MKKCKYYRESPIKAYQPKCTKGNPDVHPDDVDKYCPFCGRKIKFKEFTTVPWEQVDD